MELWLLILIVIVLVMAEALHLLNMHRKPSKRYSRKISRRSRKGNAGTNYHLAPRNPEVMAGALLALLSLKLNYEQMTAFADLVASPELTARYIERLAARRSTAGFARQLAFLCDSMEVNGFTPEDREIVSAALKRKADNEYKLLQIHKNLDKIL